MRSVDNLAAEHGNAKIVYLNVASARYNLSLSTWPSLNALTLLWNFLQHGGSQSCLPMLWTSRSIQNRNLTPTGIHLCVAESIDRPLCNYFPHLHNGGKIQVQEQAKVDRHANSMMPVPCRKYRPHSFAEWLQEYQRLVAFAENEENPGLAYRAIVFSNLSSQTGPKVEEVGESASAQLPSPSSTTPLAQTLT